MANTIIFIDNFDSFTYNLVDELKVLGNNVLVYRNDTDVDLISKIADEYKAKGDKVIIMAYANMSPEEAAQSRPVVLFLGEGNKVERKANYEKHGRLADQ